ncbi:sigma-70 family RNA polymerase sigma factor [Methyloversatilis discipulorum]|uniref:sigma-70 family RNA polymerase sigma factor n=1 Tax=Methyloversatilis discipulorum TaxID=1119528 RepID=UPI0003823D0D|nr:sigma-70 family RNA polymerase sigma factor [Methyloversatilis discipulorum]
MLDPVQLERLLARVALRDRQAFRQLYDACAPQLLGVALRLLRRRDLAEDVLQDAFTSVWHRADSYRADASQPMTWLTSIVRNRALDLLRAESVRRTESLDDDEDGQGGVAALGDDRPSPLGLLEQAADALHLRRCIDDIDGPQRQCLALAYYHGLSHSELAEHLGSPIGSVKVWLRRGLDRLRRCMERLT